MVKLNPLVELVLSIRMREAEQAIQIIMYMARFYTIHSGLNCSSDGSEDLAL